MKKCFIALLLSMCCILSYSQEQSSFLQKPRVDKQAELLSIVFRLAGRPEYNHTYFKLYTDRIANHFDKWKDHELIDFTRQLIEANGVSYDAVMGLAVNLDDKMNIANGDNKIDSRWDPNKLRKFEKLLKKFVKDSRFEEFYKQNEPLYREAERRFMPVYDRVDTKWYNDFYGVESKDMFHIILSMGNGGSNYGTRTKGENGGRNVYSIMGSWATDSTGMVVYPIDEILTTQIHEFNHSFGRYNAEDFRKNCERIYAVVGKQMESQAYGAWAVMLEEAFVRASVIKYMKDHGYSDRDIAYEVFQQKRREFFWVGKLYDELEKYAASRDTYPTLESYMPQMVKAYSDFASYTENYDDFRPKVSWISEFVNGDSTVSSNIKTITVNFDRPLVGRGYSLNHGSFGENSMPKINKIDYANQNQTVVMEVELEPNKNYSMTLLGLSFRTPMGDAMKNYEVSFRTAE